jgi:transcriptional regulator with XRE-family HTH domain
MLLRMARQAEGLSLNELAARSGLSKGYLSKLESAQPSAANPSRATLAALARALPSTVPLIQHLAPEEGLPTARSLVGGQWNVIARQIEQPVFPLPSTQSAEGGQQGGTKHKGLIGSWGEWEVLLALMIVEGAGFGPPTQAVLERACRAEAPLDELLARLEQQQMLVRLPPAGLSAPPRYTLEGTSLHSAEMQRPAFLFMQAAMNMLLGSGMGKDDPAPLSSR